MINLYSNGEKRNTIIKARSKIMKSITHQPIILSKYNCLCACLHFGLLLFVILYGTEISGKKPSVSAFHDSAAAFSFFVPITTLFLHEALNVAICLVSTLPSLFHLDEKFKKLNISFFPSSSAAGALLISLYLSLGLENS